MREGKPMGRPRAFDTDAALDAIMQVFWAKGFDGTSLQELVGATGLNKGSLYAAFGDKRAMYAQALALYDRTQIEGSVRDLTAGGPALKRIDRFLQNAIDDASARGCFVCNASIDHAASDPRARQLVRASLDRLEAALTDAVASLRAKTGDGPASDGDAMTTARHLMTVYFGLRVLARAGAAPRALEDAKDMALRALPAAR